MLKDAQYLKEHLSALVVKTAPPSDNAERLTRKSGAEQVVVGYIGGVYARDVAGGRHAKVCAVDHPRVGVYVAGENALKPKPGGG